MRGRGGRRVTWALAGIAMAVGVAWHAPAQAAGEECFLRIDGVAGDSADARHRGEIDLVSWSLGVTGPGAEISGGGVSSSSSHTDFQPLRISQHVDRAVPALFLMAASGQRVQSAILSCRRPGREAAEYLKVTLQEVQVTAVRFGDSAQAPPAAEATLMYSRITIEYRPPMPDGSLGPPTISGWDLRANKRL
jgi:type VI secretion system secreted protein Hcp